ncbi:MarR family winged helix-turn-helix transcriptional regulator [Embleya scabrispora]|uniref:MarR family winged helix-turn-helix transcriptional regulator n=1 Tax=Embleya scabrispora TaxID=159449 RepID=UPI00036B904F|nr:MarR family winged helix-turn-helix transcriptional regulator [Embleya scabrispora]MYS86843.1 MarR family transcriptional regulator [Streptomyces sp. SID5474]
MPLSPEDSPGFLLWHTTLRWQRAMAATLTPLDLTHPQFVLLASLHWLDTQGAHPNQLALATHAGMDVKTVSQVLRRLEAKGHLTRETDPTDTRAKLLRITEPGSTLAKRAMHDVEAADATFFAEVPEYASLLSSLRHLSGTPDK